MPGADRAGVRLTARGAVVLLFVITLSTGPFLPGPGFVAGCLAAVLLVQPRDLLPLVVTPPLVFFVAALLLEGVQSLGADHALRALGVGLFTMLSSSAPWLFGGTALALIAAWRRGLPANVRELRREIGGRGGRVPAAPGARAQRPVRGRRGRRTAFDPEPEGYFEPRVYGKAVDD